MVAAIWCLLWLGFEAIRDASWFNMGKHDVKWLDVLAQFVPAMLLEGSIMGDAWLMVPAFFICAGSRLWFDPLINSVRGLGFWHLGKNAWDQFIGQFNRALQLVIRIAGSLFCACVVYFWPVIKLWI